MVKEKKRSDRFYEVLPVLYIGAGLLAMLVLQNMMALTSGLLLIAVGAIEMMRRRRAGRDREAQESRHASRLASDREGPQTQALMQIAWRKSFECGHPEIDAQHRRLFEIGDTVINAVVKNKPRDHIEFLLDELTEHIQAHFSHRRGGAGTHPLPADAGAPGATMRRCWKRPRACATATGRACWMSANWSASSPTTSSPSTSSRKTSSSP